MDKFLHDENLRLLHKRLTETTDEKQRQVLHNLIAEHDAKYREWQSETRLTCSLGAGGLQALPASKSSFAHNQEVRYASIPSRTLPSTGSRMSSIGFDGGK